jgi:hypothetical protein
MKKEFDKVPPNIRFGSDDFRKYFRTELANRYPNGNYYVIFYVVTLISIIVYLLYLLDIHNPIAFLSVLIYFLFCNFFEYLFHRFPMHRKMPGMSRVYHHVTIHHNFYANELYYYETSRDYYAVIIPYYVWIHIIISTSILALIIYWSVGFNQAIIFLITVTSYYLMYELLHFSYHAPKDAWIKKIPFVKYLSNFHLIHHKTEIMSKYNFNITFPIFDKLLGTTYKTTNTNGRLLVESGSRPQV